MLTNPALSKQWIEQFWPDFGALESDWEQGSTMYWKTSSNSIDLEGEIIAIEPQRLIKYSFTTHQDIVVLKLEVQNGKTALSVTHGDFANKPDSEKCYLGAVAGWDMNLPKIKELAEKV